MSTQKTNAVAKNTKPTHTLRKNTGGYGRHANFETIGVAWEREEGGLYIKLYGTQIIDSGFYVFPNQNEATTEGGQ